MCEDLLPVVWVQHAGERCHGHMVKKLIWMTDVLLGDMCDQWIENRHYCQHYLIKTAHMFLQSRQTTQKFRRRDRPGHVRDQKCIF